jgi:hypothetical protein
MADLRLNPSPQPPALRQPTTPARSEAVRAAQRAFFDAAMSKTSSTVAASPAAAVAPTSTVAPSRAVSVAKTPLRVDPQTPPTRLLRPGSLLDITV